MEMLKLSSNLRVMYANGTGVPQDHKEAVKWYRIAADQGNAQAQFNLGVIYENGEGVPQDYKEAMKWYRMAADQGNSQAQFNLGVMLKWYRMAADQGNAQDQFNLGVMYYNGTGVPQDFAEAYAWWSVAKTNGNESAAKNLGISTKKMTKEQIAEGMSLATEIYKRIEANKKD